MLSDYKDFPTDLDLWLLSSRIKEQRQLAAIDRREPLMEMLELGNLEQEIVAIKVRLFERGTDLQFHRHRFHAFICGNEISVSIALDDSMPNSLKLSFGSISSCLFDEMGVTRWSIVDGQETNRVSFFYCWASEQWQAEAIEVDA